MQTTMKMHIWFSNLANERARATCGAELALADGDTRTGGELIERVERLDGLMDRVTKLYERDAAESALLN